MYVSFTVVLGVAWCILVYNRVVEGAAVCISVTYSGVRDMDGVAL